MPYIIKSSLDIGGKVVPWNERETQKLIKEKEKFLEDNKKVLEVQEKKVEKIEIVDEVPEDEDVLDRVDIIKNTEETKTKKNFNKKK